MLTLHTQIYPNLKNGTQSTPQAMHRARANHTAPNAHLPHAAARSNSRSSFIYKIKESRKKERNSSTQSMHTNSTAQLAPTERSLHCREIASANQFPSHAPATSNNSISFYKTELVSPESQRSTFPTQYISLSHTASLSHKTCIASMHPERHTQRNTIIAKAKIGTKKQNNRTEQVHDRVPKEC